MLKSFSKIKKLWKMFWKFSQNFFSDKCWQIFQIIENYEKCIDKLLKKSIKVLSNISRIGNFERCSVVFIKKMILSENNLTNFSKKLKLEMYWQVDKKNRKFRKMNWQIFQKIKNFGKFSDKFSKNSRIWENVLIISFLN